MILFFLVCEFAFLWFWLEKLGKKQNEIKQMEKSLVTDALEFMRLQQ
jgi:hypothetical protein